MFPHEREAVGMCSKTSRVVVCRSTCSNNVNINRLKIFSIFSLEMCLSTGGRAVGASEEEISLCRGKTCAKVEALCVCSFPRINE